MSDEIDDKDGQEPVPPKTKTPPPQPPKSSEDDIDDMDEDALRENLRKLRKAAKEKNAENLKLRQKAERLQELEAEDDRKQQASLSEVERERKRAAEAERAAKEADAKAADLQARYVRARVDQAVEAEARKQGVQYPRTQMAVEMLRGRDKNGIDFDVETDTAIGVKEAVKKLIADYADVLLGGGNTRGQGTPPREAAAGRTQPTQADKAAADAAGLMTNSRIGYSAF